MRSHSGRDEGRNTMRDPTMRERGGRRGSRGMGRASSRTTAMGSNQRKSGRRGDR